MKYQLLITANCDSDSVVIFAQEYEKSIISDGRIKEVISSLIPCVKWEYDDGDDVIGTNYCQYAAYTEPNDCTHYLLASWYAIDETKWCRII